MKNLLTVFFCILLLTDVAGQTIILGSGNSDRIKVTTSSNFNASNGDKSATGEKTINGAGLTHKQHNASRFLAQATLGADLNTITDLAANTFEEWIENQINIPPSLLTSKVQTVFEEVNHWFLAQGGDSSEIGMRPDWTEFNYAWWDVNMRNNDLLRQRIAYALTEIFVISLQSELSGFGDGLASYYDIFSRNAFGNYRDILKEVSLHPCMGFYLSHLNNPKAIPEENVHPDENYAREAMQLFSIGLYELNTDGSRKKDNQGNDIPTYSQTDIKEFAKVWTGLGVADVVPNMYNDGPFFGLGIYTADMSIPMIMYEEWHEEGEKKLLNGFIAPAGQPGMKDIEDAIDNLTDHPNVGPFIGKQLIQRLVTSNPSPAYVKRAAEAFNDNGEGIRGDMKSLIKAILLDPEARTCEALLSPTHGQLREPFVRYTHFARSSDVEQYYDRFWNVNYDFLEATGQSVLAANSVFNFFLPNYAPVGPISDSQLVAPEFQIHNSRTSIEYFNQVNNWVVYKSVMNSWVDEDPGAFLNIDALKPLANDSEVLINHFDMVFTHGQLSDRTRQIIKNAIEPLIFGDYREDRVRLALYLILISPDYAILK
jgi:uncharacterized protein (DUF1800 family)